MEHQRSAAPEDGVVEAVFGSGSGAARRYAELLTTEGIERGLLGPREGDRVWERHLLNSAVVGEGVPHDSTVVDLGSGAGLPGIPLALARPDLVVTLVEPMERRTRWLLSVVADLDLGARVHVVRGRAPHVDVGRQDAVVSRAVAPLAVLLPLCLPLCRPGGVVLAVKGESVADELTELQDSLVAWGLGDARVARFGEGLLERPTLAVVAHPGTAPPRPTSPRPYPTTGRRRP